MVVTFGNLFPHTALTGGQLTKDYLGGKGYGLVRMSDSGINVPSGIIIPTDECVLYMNLQPVMDMSVNEVQFKYVEALIDEEILPLIKDLEVKLGYRPLFSVRSGARVSMPGMMDTILNVGISDDTVHSLGEKLGRRAAWDCYRRFLQMAGEVALGIPKTRFDQKYQHVFKLKGGKGKDKLVKAAETEADLTHVHFRRMVEEYKKVIDTNHLGDVSTLQDFRKQLQMCVVAVFNSWNNERAKTYRKLNNIPDDWGTAVVIQMMVFGNMNNMSGSGVLFTRNPSTGENKLMGEFLPNAQGEDVVAGTRTPMSMDEMKKTAAWSVIHSKLTAAAVAAEKQYKDMQDMEFTVQDGELFFLQTRSGKRTTEAAFKIAVDLVYDGIITKSEAFKRISVKDLESVGKVKVADSFKVEPDATGIPAGGSVVSGKAVFTAEEAVKADEPCILVTEETTPDDIAGMNAAVGIITATGGATSHAAVVARAMNKSCVVGCGKMHEHKGEPGPLFQLNGVILSHASKIVMDGSTGRIWVDKEVPVEKLDGNEYYDKLVDWAAEGSDVVELISVDCNDLRPNRTYAVTCEGGPTEFFVNVTSLLKQAVDKNCQILLSLYEGQDVQEPSDKILWGIFGPSDDAHLKADYLTLGGKWGPNDKVTLFVPSRAAKYVDKLKAAGFKVGGEVHSLDELLAANGSVMVSSSLIKQVGGPKTWEKLRVLIEKGGLKIGAPPKVLSRKQMLFDKISEVM